MQASTAPLAPPAPGPHAHLPAPVHWDAILPLLAPYLDDHEARTSLRLVSRAWRAAVDTAWSRGAANCALLPSGPGRAFLSSGAFLFPHLVELCLVEIVDSGQLEKLLSLLMPQRLPMLQQLVLSAPLGCQLAASSSSLARLPQQVRGLQLDDILLGGGCELQRLTHLEHLTSLSISLQRQREPLTRTSARLQRSAACRAILAATGVSALTALRHLQALQLPQLQEEERGALSALTSLTSLAFTAAGQGAVGPSLRPLTRLARLCISLAHTHERFLVLHPRLEWAQLRWLTALTSLTVTHLAANTFFPVAEVAWATEPAAQEADSLLAALPGMQQLHMRLSYCRLLEEHVTGDEAPQRVVIGGSDDGPHGSACRHPRLFHRTIQRVPVHTPGHRRPASWYDAWWQPAVQAQLAAGRVHPGGRAEEASLRYTWDTTEVAGWTAIRAGNYRSFDTLVEYELVNGPGTAAVSSYMHHHAAKSQE